MAVGTQQKQAPFPPTHVAYSEGSPSKFLPEFQELFIDKGFKEYIY